MKYVAWEGPDGRKWRRLVPDDAEEWEGARGIPSGPPDVADLGLPIDVMYRLHSELYNRGLWDLTTIRRRRSELESAVRAAMRLDVQRLELLYSPQDVEAL